MLASRSPLHLDSSWWSLYTILQSDTKTFQISLTFISQPVHLYFCNVCGAKFIWIFQKRLSYKHMKLQLPSHFSKICTVSPISRGSPCWTVPRKFASTGKKTQTVNWELFINVKNLSALTKLCHDKILLVRSSA